jgi:uncharacterized protein (TIGR00106 family)
MPRRLAMPYTTDPSAGSAAAADRIRGTGDGREIQQSTAVAAALETGCQPLVSAMKVIVDLCVVPIGVGVQLAPYIAACEKVLAAAGLRFQLHPNGTAIEGEWGPVFAAIEACHRAVHAMGCPRIYTTVKINTRTDRDQTLEEKVASVEALL